MSLSVCCFTQDPGDRVYAILSLFRPVVDEIVVAADSHVGDSELAAYGAVADRLLRFRHDGTQRHHTWFHAQCSSDWILRIDGDEVPSAALLEQLPSLTSRPEVLQYWLPTRWLFPDREHWLDELPWWPSYNSRLLLNSSAQRFPGAPHTGANPIEPARYLETPLYHLDSILSPWTERKNKVHRYASFRPASHVAGGGAIGTYYLPERRSQPRLARVPQEDLELIDRVLGHSGGSYEPVGTVPIVSDHEIERVWAGRRLEPDAYRASITAFERDWRMRAGECRPIFFAIRNEGTARWPWGLEEPPLIRVAYRWLDSDGRVIVSETPRSGFPARVDPGETCITPVVVTAPGAPGDYVLELDLVHEFERWFECEARFPTAVIDRVGPWKLPRERAGDEPGVTTTIGRLAYLGRRRAATLGDRAMLEAFRTGLGDIGGDGPPAGVVVGGGTLIGRIAVREALERLLEADHRLPLFAFSTGIADPLFHEDDRKDVVDELVRWRELLQRFERVTVRGERSRELLEELDVPADVTGDPALLLGADRVGDGDPQLVGINVGVAERIWGNDPELLLDQVAAFGQAMVGRGHRVRLVPLGAEDRPYAREAARRMGNDVELIEPSSLDAALDAIASCGILVGQKLSSVALASALVIPSVMLAYHPKCVELHAALDLEEFTLRTDSLLVTDLVDRVDALTEDRDRHRHRLSERVGALRERLHEELGAIQSAVTASSSPA